MSASLVSHLPPYTQMWFYYSHRGNAGQEQASGSIDESLPSRIRQSRLSSKTGPIFTAACCWREEILVPELVTNREYLTSPIAKNLSLKTPSIN